MDLTRPLAIFVLVQGLEEISLHPEQVTTIKTLILPQRKFLGWLAMNTKQR